VPVIGQKLNITANFRDSNGNLVDPDFITIELIDVNGVPILGATPSSPEKLSIGVYRYSWTPDIIGEMTIVFTGEFTGSDDVILRCDFVIVTDQEDSTAPSLGEDVVITFSSGYDPMLVDPEFILSYYPEAPVIEIAQWVHRFSLEVNALFGANPPKIALDYIHAAVLCALSRQYEGIGSAGSSGFTLGDLQVSDGGGTSSRKADRGNAMSWCELAEVLRREMKMAKGGMRSSVKALNWGTPIPGRRLRKAERGRGGC